MYSLKNMAQSLCFVKVHLSFHSQSGSWQELWLLWEQFHFPLSLWAPSPTPARSAPPPPCPRGPLAPAGQMKAVSLQGHSRDPALCFIWLQSVFPSLPHFIFASQPGLYFPVMWAVEVSGYMSQSWNETSLVPSPVSYQLGICLWASPLTPLNLSDLMVNQHKNGTHTTAVVMNIYYEHFSHCLPQNCT